MTRARLAFGMGVLFGLGGTSAVSAQALSELCPNADEGTGALWGTVTDPDVGMVLPGATVAAKWTRDGAKIGAEVSAGLDGSFILCYVPLDTELSVQTLFGTMEGQVTTLTLTEPVTEQDLSFSMAEASSGSASGDDRIWACFLGGDSSINLQNSRLIRCDTEWKPLEQCPRDDLGMVTARGVGVGTGVMREMLETITDEAKRVGANALINIRARGGTIMAEAVKIEIDPKTC